MYWEVESLECELNVLSSSNSQLSLFLISTKSYMYLKFWTIRTTHQTWMSFEKALFSVYTYNFNVR